MAEPEGVESNEHLDSFEALRRAPGESVLCWVVATGGDGDPAPGVAVLTDRRLCLHHASLPEASRREVPVLGKVLRYAPVVDGDFLRATFETDGGPLSFVVEGETERRHFENLLGNLKDLRDAQDRMEMSGLDPAFVSPPREGESEGVSALYQLMRLRELMNLGILGEMDFALERTMMIQRFVEQGAGPSGDSHS